MQNIKHIFFDLDNTLWDFEKNSREALHELFVRDEIEKHIQKSFNNFLLVYENINHQLWQAYGLKKITKDELRIQRFSKSFEYFSFYNIDLATKWSDDYIAISPYKTNLIEGALDILNYLNPNYSLHLITNGFKEVQHIKLNESKLKPFFNRIIISEEHGFNKPQLELFQIAEKLSGADKTNSVMIGDSYEADIEGAINAGWKAIYLTQQFKKNVNCIKTLNDLKSTF